MVSPVGIQPSTIVESVTSQYAPPSDARLVSPSDIPNLQTIINNAPVGATILFTPGVYRNVPTLTLKSNITLLGTVNAAGDLLSIFNGSVVLASGWQKESNGTWSIGYNRISVFEPHGQLQAGFEGNGLLHSLLYNGKFLNRKRTLNELLAAGEGWWFWDYTANRIYTTSDPSSATVELGLVSYPFRYGSEVDNVKIKALHFKNYANHAQMGVLGAQFPLAKNWTIDYCTISTCKGLGINAGDGWQIINCKALQNGFSGIGSGSNTRRSNILIKGCEMAYNNQLSFNVDWDAGAGKFSTTDNLILQGNWAHHNRARGLWTDIENINSTIVNNVCEYNDNEGIMHEISHDAYIAYNLCRFNSKQFNWLYGPQILVSSSNNVTVENNVCEVHPDYGQGISVLMQERGTSRLTNTRFSSSNAIVRKNIIAYRGKVARPSWPQSTMFGYDTRILTDAPELTAKLGENKHYIMPEASNKVLYWNGAYRDPRAVDASEEVFTGELIITAEYIWSNGFLQPLKDVVIEDVVVLPAEVDKLKADIQSLKAVNDQQAVTISDLNSSMEILQRNIDSLQREAGDLRKVNQSLTDQIEQIKNSKVIDKAALLDSLIDFQRQLSKF